MGGGWHFSYSIFTFRNYSLQNFVMHLKKKKFATKIFIYDRKQQLNS